jgi:hypothetical protein
MTYQRKAGKYTRSSLNNTKCSLVLAQDEMLSNTKLPR